MELIYLDNHLLIVVKPQGIATQPELHEQAKMWLKSTAQKEGNVFLHPIHRLDQPVSGMVVFARTSKALSRMNELLRKQEIEKTYLAKVEGIPKEKEGQLEHFLFHDEHHAKVSETFFPGAKKAILSYKVVKILGKNALLEIALHTGRYHQIRAQLAFSGHPIVGDKKYGSQTVGKDGGISLCHVKLGFTHPVTKERLTFSHEPLTDF